MTDKVKILYVEDEPFLGKIVRESLESRNFEVTHIQDGSKALDAFKSLEPHICLLDVMLPNKSGFEIGTDIRLINSGIPIVFLTAKDQTEDVLKGFESGGNDYLKKPFSIEELIVRINNLLAMAASNKGQQPKHNLEEVYSIGAFRFDPNSMELSIASSSRKLSYKETQLLRILYNNRNSSIDRRIIMKQVWGDDDYSVSRNLDVYIRKLREYLSEDPEIELITLKGVGYRFMVNG